MTTLEIRSIGLPPERHADRVVAEMMRELAKKHATLWDEIGKIVKTSGGAGSPKAQRKLAGRIERAGAVYTKLFPGKRGRFEILIYDFTGFDVSRDEEIKPGDVIPPKPWIACNISQMTSHGGGRNVIEAHGRPILFITCHSMSRVAQRLGARTSKHLIITIEVIWKECIKLINEKGHNWFTGAPPDGWRVPLPVIGDKVFAVLKRHDKRIALICATVIIDNS